MRLAFVQSISTPRDATECHASLPRPLRRALRYHTPTTARAYVQSHDGVDDYIAQGYKVDTYHNQNLEYLDRGYDYDEFGDIDNELDGLTIHEPMDEAQLWAFCTGYDVL